MVAKIARHFIVAIYLPAVPFRATPAKQRQNHACAHPVYDVI
jgi:hypothetical protein